MSSTPAAAKYTFTPYQKLVIVMLTLTQFTVILDFMIMNPISDMLMKTIHISPSKLGIVVSAYAFSAAISGIVSSGFADRYDRKKLLVFFYSGFFVGTLWCGLARSFEMLLLGRIVAGIFGGVLASLPGCLYVNHPHRVGDAEFKPSGLAVAVSAGFLVPPTLITSSPDAARAFIKQHGPVIYKPLYNPVYRIDGVSSVVKIAEVAVEDIDDSVAGTAHLFQQRVEKISDVRVTVIGDQVFAVRIDSDLLDWRTDYSRLRYSVDTPPPGVTEALHAYLSHFGLVFGAFDFAVDRAGRWWFLECNPSGQWYWLEDETGLPMLAAMADLLERKSL